MSGGAERDFEIVRRYMLGETDGYDAEQVALAALARLREVYEAEHDETCTVLRTAYSEECHHHDESRKRIATLERALRAAVEGAGGTERHFEIVDAACCEHSKAARDALARLREQSDEAWRRAANGMRAHNNFVSEAEAKIAALERALAEAQRICELRAAAEALEGKDERVG